jgi:ankyrin repeat protein
MTWLHYAASMGSLQVVQLLLQHGSDPNALNGYKETPFFMACQAGHYNVACCLLPVTDFTSYSNELRSTTELHFLDRFDKAFIEDMASKLLEKGIDVDSQNNIGQTPLNAILDRNGVNCMNSVQVLLQKGADPLVKDETRINPLSQAAVNLSKSQFMEVFSFVPYEKQLEAQADALWALMELVHLNHWHVVGQATIRS